MSIITIVTKHFFNQNDVNTLEIPYWVSMQTLSLIKPVVELEIHLTLQLPFKNNSKDFNYSQCLYLNMKYAGIYIIVSAIVNPGHFTTKQRKALLK